MEQAAPPMSGADRRRSMAPPKPKVQLSQEEKDLLYGTIALTGNPKNKATAADREAASKQKWATSAGTDAKTDSTVADHLDPLVESNAPSISQQNAVLNSVRRSLQRDELEASRAIRLVQLRVVGERLVAHQSSEEQFRLSIQRREAITRARLYAARTETVAFLLELEARIV